MRSFLCVSLVCLFATTAAAQFSKNPPTRSTARTAEATPRKTAEKARTDRTAKATDQATAETDLANALLAIIDTDGDGIVTKVEMTKAMAALHKVHKDKQGNITVAAKPADTDPAAVVDPTQVGAAEGGRANNEAMAQFMRYDANHDGVLTPNEVPPQTRAMLREADLNGDGIISAVEFQAFSRKMGAMKAAAAGAGQNGAGVPGDGRKPPRNDK
jgi:Ca2+-binding EF-hand superfamily protein